MPRFIGDVPSELGLRLAIAQMVHQVQQQPRQAERLAYGSGPFTPDDMKINNWNGGRGVYFRDPNGHLLELLTRDYKRRDYAK